MAHGSTVHIQHWAIDLAMRVYDLMYRMGVDVSYAAPQAHGIVTIALHWEYSLGIIFISSQGKQYIYHV
jgi:hypothetical protein